MNNILAASEDSLSISKDDGSRDIWIERLSDQDLRASATRADILFLPSGGHADHKDPLFPEGTRELFQVVRNSAGSSLAVEVASTDEEYAELTLHSNEWILPIIWIVNDAAAQIVLNIVAAHLYDRLKRLHPGKSAQVKSELILNDHELRLRYDGPADAYLRVISEVLKSGGPPSQISHGN